MKKNFTEQTRRQILTGNLWKVIISVSFPLFFYATLNSLYNLIDQIMVSNISAESVSAVAVLSQIKNLISSLGGGIASGGAIIIAKKYGAGNINDAKKYSNTLFTICLIICSLLLGICLPFSSTILNIAHVPQELINISLSYFMLSIVEQALIVINNVYIGLEKSKGNTKTIFLLNFISMAIKLTLNAIFIYLIKVDNLIWVEVSSLIAQSLIFIIGLLTMFNKNNIFNISIKNLNLKFEHVKKIIIISFPLFLGKFVMSLGKVTVNAMCEAYGALTVGALGISNNMCGLITSGTSSFEDSESSIVSQNLGNKNMKRTIKVFINTLIISCIWGLTGFILMRFVFLDEIIMLFNTKNESLEFVNMIKNIFYYDCLTIIALMINSAVLGLLYGYGQTFLATLSNLLRIGTRIGVLWFLQTFHPEIGAEAAGISMGISNILIAIFAIVFLIIFLIKIKIKGYKGCHFNDPEPIMIEKDGILINSLNN